MRPSRRVRLELLSPLEAVLTLLQATRAFTRYKLALTTTGTSQYMVTLRGFEVLGRDLATYIKYQVGSISI